jgi:hypothetical protein
MGKKGKKSFYKKQLRPFVKSNQVLLAALGGAAAGITLSSLLGTEKAKQVFDTVQTSMKDFSDKVINGLTNDKQTSNGEKRSKAVPAI